MLVVRRECNQTVIINHVVNVQVVEIRSTAVRLGFWMPKEYGFARGEDSTAVRAGQENEETMLMRRLISIMNEKAGANASHDNTLWALAALAERELARPAG
jgi:carbon storage regulator CsrA